MHQFCCDHLNTKKCIKHPYAWTYFITCSLNLSSASLVWAAVDVLFQNGYNNCVGRLPLEKLYEQNGSMMIHSVNKRPNPSKNRGAFLKCNSQGYCQESNPACSDRKPLLYRLCHHRNPWPNYIQCRKLELKTSACDSLQKDWSEKVVRIFFGLSRKFSDPSKIASKRSLLLKVDSSLAKQQFNCLAHKRRAIIQGVGSMDSLDEKGCVLAPHPVAPGLILGI